MAVVNSCCEALRLISLPTNETPAHIYTRCTASGICGVQVQYLRKEGTTSSRYGLYIEWATRVLQWKLQAEASF